MLITVLMPDQTKMQLEVAPTDLVFDGTDFVSPSKAKYVMLYQMPTSALSLAFDDIAVQTLLASTNVQAQVLDRTDDTATQTDPTVVAVPDPSDGDCVCLVNCSGTQLGFVSVQSVPNP
jgi:hypothetical protein